MFENLNNSLKTNVTWISGSLSNMANDLIQLIFKNILLEYWGHSFMAGFTLTWVRP